MLLLAVLSAVSQSPVPSTGVRAEARIQIVGGANVSKREWIDFPANRRREKVVIEQGRKANLRLMEFE